MASAYLPHWYRTWDATSLTEELRGRSGLQDRDLATGGGRQIITPKHNILDDIVTTCTMAQGGRKQNV